MSPGGEASASMEGGGVCERYCTQPPEGDKEFSVTSVICIEIQCAVCAVFSPLIGCFCGQLMMPHVRTSLKINMGARASLLAGGGVFDKVDQQQ